MGGFGGDLRGKTKSEVWTKFEQQIRPHVENEFGLFLEDPLAREAAYRQMWKDEISGNWVLDYYFSK